MQIKTTVTGDEPLTLTEVKDYCYVDHSTDDTYFTALITRVREIAEHATDRSLVVKTIEYFEEDYEDTITLPYPPHNEITELTVDGVDVLASCYQTGLTQKIVTIPSVSVTGTGDDQGLYVKYTTLQSVPDGLKEAMLKHIKSLYDNRGNETDYNANKLKYDFQSICAAYRL